MKGFFTRNERWNQWGHMLDYCWGQGNHGMTSLYNHILVGGLNKSEKYEFVNWDDNRNPIYWKIEHVPNHQPVSQWIAGKISSCRWRSVAKLSLFQKNWIEYQRH